MSQQGLYSNELLIMPARSSDRASNKQLNIQRRLVAGFKVCSETRYAWSETNEQTLCLPWSKNDTQNRREANLFFLGFLQEKHLPHVVVRRSILDSHLGLRPNDKKLHGLGHSNTAREKLLTQVCRVPSRGRKKACD
jgi:hypothetical protein